MADGPNVVDLGSRPGYRPDMAGLARAQVIAARSRLGLTSAEFAEVLKPLLGWAPTAGVVENWERDATPPGDVVMAAGVVSQAAPLDLSSTGEGDIVQQLLGRRYADVEAVFTTRAEFTSQMPTQALLDAATTIDAAGLSLNLLCQQYPDHMLRKLVEDGATLRCLFLAPHGTSIAAREDEEDYPRGHLSTLTEMNIQILNQRVRERLPTELRERLTLATYDETIRFNILLVNGSLGVVQPYLPGERGVESPTFVLRQHVSWPGLYTMFEHTFAWLWERSTPI
jgi:hypothetical protein